MRAAVLAFTLLASPVLAQQPDNLVRALCQKTGCDEFQVVSSERVRQNELGYLMRTQIRTFIADNRGRHPMGEEHGYVFCSYERPTIIAESRGQYMAFEIAPFSRPTQQEARAQTNFVAMYFTVCHGAPTGREAIRDLWGVAEELGYVPTALQRSGTRPIRGPEEIMR